MADASFDAVIIGGGKEGLVMGCYLGLNGLTVGLFEQGNELGGSACTGPVPAAGFLGNPHAEICAFWMSPAYYDFNLGDKGLDFVFPEVMMSKIFPDGRCIVVYRAIDWDKDSGQALPNQTMIDKNLAELERISPRDAERVSKALEKKLYNWMFSHGQCLFNPPPLPGEMDYIDMLLNDPEGGIDPRYPYMTEYEIVLDIYESPEMRSMALQWQLMNGIAPGDVAPPLQALLPYPSFAGLQAFAIAKGGFHNVAHSLQRALSEQGGKFFVGADVDEVLIENGRARGIRLTDGTEIEAKKMVVNTAEIKQTVSRHLRNADVDPEIRRKIDNVMTDRSQLFWGHMCFHELPQYEAAAWNPDCGRARWVFLGDADVEYMYRHYGYKMHNLRPGQWPEKTYMSELPSALWDPTYAPPGKHVSLVAEGHPPPASYLTEREWVQVRKEVGDRFINEWQKYAPNMTWDNVIGVNIPTPMDIAGHNPNWVDGCMYTSNQSPSQWSGFRPIPEFAQYQVPGIEDFWMASGSQHTGGTGTLGFSAYNCYKRMAPLFGFRKTWEEQGRMF
jgi:phytoene dehydrogenase-like protein